MTQFNLDTPIVATAKSGTQLASDLSNWRDAVHSNHKGSSQPSYRVAGMIWVDDTTSTMWVIKMWDGAAWALIGYHDTTNDLFFPATQNPRFNFPVTAGTQPTYTLTLAPALTAYVDQSVFTFEVHSANTGASTLNVNTLGAKKIMKIVSGTPTALSGGELQVGVRYFLSYDSAADSAAGAFILVQPSLDLPSLSGVITNSQLPDRLQEGASNFVTSNANEADENGWWQSAAANTNNPNSTDLWLIHVSVRITGTDIVQDAFAPRSALHYRRYKDNNSWTSWTRIYDTASEVDSRVDNGLAGIAYGAVGSHALLEYDSVGPYTEGGTSGGSNLQPAGIVSNTASTGGDGANDCFITAGGGFESGTWRRHHRNNYSGTRSRVGLWFRIS